MESFSKYQLLKKIAVGGMGTVYIARVSQGPSTGRIVCLKRISDEHAKSADYRRLFLSEIRVMLGLSHANLVTFLDAGEERDRLYITMDYIEGKSLREVLGSTGARGQSIDPPVAIGITLAVAEGLHYTHTYFDRPANATIPIIHRDINPSNVVIGYDGTVKIIDFGIAQPGLAGAVAGEPRMGKLSYMAPEQITGGTIDARTDIYALGVVLWELLAGRALFAGKTTGEVMWKLTSSDFQIPSVSAGIRSLPPAVDEVLRFALMRERTARPASMAEFRTLLERVLRQVDPTYGPEKIKAFIMSQYDLVIRREREELARLCEKALPNAQKPEDETVQLSRTPTLRAPEPGNSTFAADATRFLNKAAPTSASLPIPLPKAAPKTRSPERVRTVEKVELLPDPSRPRTRPAAAIRKVVAPIPDRFQNVALKRSSASLPFQVAGLSACLLLVIAYFQSANENQPFRVAVQAASAGHTEFISTQLRIVPETTNAAVQIAGEEILNYGNPFTAPLGVPFDIIVDQPGFKYYRKRTTLRRDDPNLESIPVKLVPENMGTITVTTSLSAEVEITSGPLRWRLPSPIDALPVPPGPYHIVIRNEGLAFESEHDLLVISGRAPRIREAIVLRAPAAVPTPAEALEPASDPK